MRKYILILIFLMGIKSLYSQDLVPIAEKYIVRSVSGKVEYQHPLVPNLWIKVTSGNIFNQNIRIRVPSRSTLVISDSINVYELPTGLDDNIKNLVLAENVIIHSLQEILAEEERKRQENKKTESDKTTFGINANAGGVIPLGNALDLSGPSLNFEFTINNFYSIVNINLPIQNSVGFGILGIFNYLWNTKIGDFYIGGGLGYTYHENHFFSFGANIGYKFITSFGMFFNVGGYIGGKISEDFMLDVRPVLGVGYLF